MWPDDVHPWRGTFVRSQAESLRALGLAVEVIAIRGYLSPLEYLTAIAELRRRAPRSFDLVHAHYGHAGAVGRLQLGAPLVLSYCGDDLLGTPGEDGKMTPRSRVEAALFRNLARACAATITKSAEMERHLPRSCRARNSVIPNGVDLARFRPIDRGEARRRLGWDETAPTVIFANDPTVPRKNYALAQAAVVRAAEALPGLRLQVVAALAPDDMPVAMSAADALLLTSRSEGSPNVVKEAMASGLPVVSTPVGDVPERLRGVCGCHTCPPDPDALAAALTLSVRGGRSAAARRAICALSLESVAQRVIRVYESALARHGHARKHRCAPAAAALDEKPAVAA